MADRVAAWIVVSTIGSMMFGFFPLLLSCVCECVESSRVVDAVVGRESRCGLLVPRDATGKLGGRVVGGGGW